MKYEATIFKPGIDRFDKKGEPHPYPAEVTTFDAKSHTEARFIAAEMYKKSGLKQFGHYNVGLATS